MTALRLTCALLCAACAPSERSDSLQPQHQAIVGGSPSSEDLNVFLLGLWGDNGTHSTCTATLIGPRTLLTAAHCVDPSMLGAERLEVLAANAAEEGGVEWGVTSLRVVETRVPPRWNLAAGLEGDIALALLEMPSTVAPTPWNALTLAGKGGRPVRAVGYGNAASDGGGGGIKRSVALSIRQISPELISLGNFTDKGICHGDSGGPTFHTFPDGIERLVGVHSFTRSPDCLDGADTRIDAYVPFVLEWLWEKEGGCGAYCVALGQPCETAFQCHTQVCISDVQHPSSYCSGPCNTDGDCLTGWECDATRHVCQMSQRPEVSPNEACILGETFCLNDFVCSQSGSTSAHCRKRCTQNAECFEGQRCLADFNEELVCVEAPDVTVPLVPSDFQASGCGTSGALWPVLGLLLGRRRRWN